jgi:hypothetical protein
MSNTIRLIMTPSTEISPKYGAMRTEAHKRPERNTIAWRNSFS